MNFNSEIVHIHLAPFQSVFSRSWDYDKIRKQKKQEVIASLADVKEISVNVPVATVSSELNNNFTFFFALLSASFGKSLDEH